MPHPQQMDRMDLLRVPPTLRVQVPILAAGAASKIVHGAVCVLLDHDVDAGERVRGLGGIPGDYPDIPYAVRDVVVETGRGGTYIPPKPALMSSFWPLKSVIRSDGAWPPSLLETT